MSKQRLKEDNLFFFFFFGVDSTPNVGLGLHNPEIKSQGSTSWASQAPLREDKWPIHGHTVRK